MCWQRNNPQAKLQYQMRMAQLWKKHDCNPLKSMGSIFVQVPLFIGFFGALRSFAAAKVRIRVQPCDPYDTNFKQGQSSHYPMDFH